MTKTEFRTTYKALGHRAREIAAPFHAEIVTASQQAWLAADAVRAEAVQRRDRAAIQQAEGAIASYNLSRHSHSDLSVYEDACEQFDGMLTREDWSAEYTAARADIATRFVAAIAAA